MFASCCWFQNYKTFDIVLTTTVPCHAQYIREFYCSDFQVINTEKKDVLNMTQIMPTFYNNGCKKRDKYYSIS